MTQSKSNRICSVPGCGPYEKGAKGYCNKHYKRWRVHGDPLKTVINLHETCTIPSCDKKHKAKGLCAYHYRVERNKTTKRRCTFEGCDKPHVAKGYCAEHYDRWRATGSPEDTRVSRTEIMKGMLAEATPEECVLWPYTENSHGYGYIEVDGRKWTAHRYSFISSHRNQSFRQSSLSCSNNLP